MTCCMAASSIATLAAALILLASAAARSEDAKPAALDRSLIENGRTGAGRRLRRLPHRAQRG